jgi:hypothetical protein
VNERSAMNDRVDLKIFHYHFLTGGVSTVVRQAVEAFRDHLPVIRSLELAAGEIPEQFRALIREYGGKCTDLPEIGYLQTGDGLSDDGRKPDKGRKPERDRKSTAREAMKLAEVLLGSFGSDDSVWWIHNYHLGKNVVFTQALLEIIASGRPQRMILQIHDFPECGRFGNLRLLKELLSLDPYPVSPWVRYAVLYQRDRQILISAGIPRQAVFLLENPVLPSPVPGRDKTIRYGLKRAFGLEFPRFDPHCPLLLYPIRTIRRKNTLEALLLCLLLQPPTNILITLPGISASERHYSDLVKGLFDDRLCPGLWGIGSRLQQSAFSFEDLVAASDLVLSTSVQEGFGYLFIHSLLWSLPLAARDLDILSGLKTDLFEGYPGFFYNAIRVPVPEARSLAESYRRKIDRLSSLIPRSERDRLLAEVEQLAQNDQLDFSYLPVEDQERLIREITSAGSAKLASCRAANSAVLSRIEELLEMQLEGETDARLSKAEEVDRRFGAAAYCSGFRGILDSFGEPGGQVLRSAASTSRRPGTGRGIATGVLRAFLRLEQLRLLYDY